MQAQTEPVGGVGVRPTAGRFVFLDGLRGIAALLVAAMHAAAIFKLNIDLPNVGLAVDFFFCLSGFVIALAYDAKIRTSLTFGQFAWRRFARLYPMLFIGIILGAIVAFTKQPASSVAIDVALALTLIPVLTGFLSYPLNFPMWSLFFEGLANIAYGIDGGRIRPNVLMIIAAFGGLLLVALVAAAGHVITFGVGGRSFVLGVVRVFYPFVVGVLIHRLSIWKWAPRVPAWMLAIALSAALIAPTHAWLYQAAMVSVIMPGIVALGAAATVGGGRRLWGELGRVSYPLYLIHAPLLELMLRLLGGAHSLYFAGGALLATVALAFVALMVLDEPIRKGLLTMPAAAFGSRARPAE